MYIHPSLKKKTLPTIPEALKAMQQADADDEKSRDVRPLMSILMRMLETSPRLRGLALTRRVAVTSFGWDIVADDPAFTEDAQQAKRRQRKTIKRLLNRHQQTPIFGALAAKLAWDMTEIGFMSRIERMYNPVEIERTGDDRSQIVVLEGDAKSVQKVNASLDTASQKWVLDVDEDSTVQGGILRSLMFHEILRKESVEEWANFNRKIKGLVLASYPEHASDEDIDTAVETLRALASHNYAATPDLIKYEFVKTVDSIGVSSFKELKNALEIDESIAVVGQANTTELPDSGGSRAALQVLKMISADIHFADIDRCETFITDSVLLYDYQLNVQRDAIDVPYRLVINIAEEHDVESEARTASELINTGIPLKRAEVYARCGYSVPQEDDDVISKQEPGVPGLP